MLLAAGRGDRMEPLSSIIPKPALEVLGLPLLSSALDNLRRAGCAEIVVNLHRHPAEVAAAVREVGGGAAVFSWEPELLGGMGGVAAARPLLGDGEVLLGNADTWGALDLTPLVAACDGSAVVLAVVPHPDPNRWSSVILDKNGLVTRFLPAGAADTGERLLFTGFQILGRNVVAALPDGRGEMASLWNTVRRRHRLRGVVVHGTWREAGNPASYRELVVESLGRDSWIHPSAVVEDGSRLERSAVGAGCRVASGSALEGCVLTAGATVGSGCELVDCVLAGAVTVVGETLSDMLVMQRLRAPLHRPR